jgi:CRISPR-associated endoribonuclease Cas6
MHDILPLPDLTALVLRLRAVRTTYIQQHLGRAVYKLGLDILGCSDPALAQHIHDLVGEKPFTASGLMRGAGILLGSVAPDEPAWIRFGGLNAPVTRALYAFHGFAAVWLALGQELLVEIDRLPWQVEAVGWDGTGHLPGLFAYQQLIDRHSDARPRARTRLRFLSATTFHSQGVNLPLPLPTLVFGSLATRWTAFTHLRLRDLPDDQVDAFIAHHLLLSRHAVQSAAYRFKDSLDIGFTGLAQFETARRSPHLRKRDPALAAALEADWPWFARLTELLADFAFYAGVGKKTTAGMGQVRPD